MDSDIDLDVMQAANVFGMVGLLSCLNQTLLELGRFHGGLPGPWLDALEKAYGLTLTTIAFKDPVPRPQDYTYVAYVSGIIQSLITGVHNTLIDPTVPPSFPPHRIVINPDNLSVPPGHKPYHLSDFGAESPFVIIRADTNGAPVSGPKYSPDKALPERVAAPALAVVTMRLCLATTLLQLSKHHGDVPAPWLDDLTQNFDERMQDLRASGFSEQVKMQIINFARGYVLHACNSAQHHIAKKSQAA